jgi:hypothetical protein
VKVAELIEKLHEYEADAPVALRMDVDGNFQRDTLTDLAQTVYRTTRGLVVIEGRDL